MKKHIQMSCFQPRFLGLMVRGGHEYHARLLKGLQKKENLLETICRCYSSYVTWLLSHCSSRHCHWGFHRALGSKSGESGKGKYRQSCLKWFNHGICVSPESQPWAPDEINNAVALQDNFGRPSGCRVSFVVLVFFFSFPPLLRSVRK